MIFDKFISLLYRVSKISDGNMSLLKENPKETIKNRIKFLKSFGLTLDQIVVPNLVHGIEIIEVNKKDLGKGAYNIETVSTADGIITNQKGVFLFLLTADCLPISFFDPKNQAVGLIHAGWKGLDLDIISEVIKIMNQKYKTNAKKLLISIGPSIGPCCYSGHENLEQKDDPRWTPHITQAPDGKYTLDLWGMAETLLMANGIPKIQIDNPRVCTYHSGEYFSSRKSHKQNLPNDYRSATILGIRDD